ALTVKGGDKGPSVKQLDPAAPLVTVDPVDQEDVTGTSAAFSGDLRLTDLGHYKTYHFVVSSLDDNKRFVTADQPLTGAKQQQLSGAVCFFDPTGNEHLEPDTSYEVTLELCQPEGPCKTVGEPQRFQTRAKPAAELHHSEITSNSATFSSTVDINDWVGKDV